MIGTILTVLWFAFIFGVPLVYALNPFELVHGESPEDEVD